MFFKGSGKIYKFFSLSAYNKERLKLYGDNDKIIIFILQCIFFITFFYIGLLKEYGYIFYFFLILAIVIGVYNQIIIKSRKSKLCLIAFKNNQYIGFLIFLGIYGEYIL